MPLLTKSETDCFHQNGYLPAIPVLSQEEITRYRSLFDSYLERHREKLASLPARDKYRITSQMHFVYKWVFELVSQPRILDAVEDLIGPNLLAWDANWFIKMPGDKTYVSWHQDGTYWNMSTPKVITAWIALSDCGPSNGCMRVIPGTHEQPAIPQRETDSPNNALSRGQTILSNLSEDTAVDLILRPGEMSLHHVWIVHGSNPNTSSQPRVGIAIRYVATEVENSAPTKPLALLVRGQDTFGHFELLDPPHSDQLLDIEASHHRIIERIRAGVMVDK